MSVNFLPLLSLALGNLLLAGCVSKAEAYDDASGEVSSDDASSSVSADDIADLAASLAATQAELASLKSSVDCFVGHMTDDWHISYISESSCQSEDSEDAIWLEDQNACWVQHTGDWEWSQGEAESDAIYAYDDCF